MLILRTGVAIGCGFASMGFDFPSDFLRDGDDNVFLRAGIIFGFGFASGFVMDLDSSGSDFASGFEMGLGFSPNFGGNKFLLLFLALLIGKENCIFVSKGG